MVAALALQLRARLPHVAVGFLKKKKLDDGHCDKVLA